MTALGTAFDNVNLSKNISFKAFDGLPGVTISNFNLPSDDPAGGIHIETDSDIPSPARECTSHTHLKIYSHHYYLELGIELGTVAFLAYYEGTEVGRKSLLVQALVIQFSATSNSSFR